MWVLCKKRQEQCLAIVRSVLTSPASFSSSLLQLCPNCNETYALFTVLLATRCSWFVMECRAQRGHQRASKIVWVRASENCCSSCKLRPGRIRMAAILHWLSIASPLKHNSFLLRSLSRPSPPSWRLLATGFPPRQRSSGYLSAHYSRADQPKSSMRHLAPRLPFSLRNALQFDHGCVSSSHALSPCRSPSGRFVLDSILPTLSLYFALTSCSLFPPQFSCSFLSKLEQGRG